MTLPSSVLIQAKEELFHLFTTRLGKSSAFADLRKSAFFQNAQRATIVFRGTSVQRYNDVGHLSLNKRADRPRNYQNLAHIISRFTTTREQKARR